MKISVTDQLKQTVFEAVKAAYPEIKINLEDIALEHPAAEEHGDYSSNIALKLVRQLKTNPQEISEKIVSIIQSSSSVKKKRSRFLDRREINIDSVEAKGGFINFKLSQEWLIGEMGKIGEIGELREKYGQNEALKNKKIMVEFAHPNTHKELHIGHMRTLITGEALARILEANGAKIFRANYQGDIGPHVAKAIWGTQQLLTKRKMSWAEAEKLSLKEKAHLLGEGYVEGNKEENKGEIDGLNTKLYQKDPSVKDVYQQTRKWSLDYYNAFYTRFSTKFDKLYFESGVAEAGKKIVLENVPKIFEKSDGAVVFPGEKYGLHTRVFVTTDGNPTYEAKDMALAPAQFADFAFDWCVHVVANEQAGYFKVIIKALELIDPKFEGKESHLSMGMVQLVGQKISSRTGVLVTVDGLLDEVKNLLKEHTKNEEILEAATIGAVKYSVLKTAPTLNSTFDLEKTVALDGDSGPYLQYTYARARSVLRHAEVSQEASHLRLKKESPCQGLSFSSEELSILRFLYRFPEIVEAAAKQYAPNLLCTYLFELAKRFNNLYNNCPILGNDFRLKLTEATSIILSNGLKLLGIEAPERM